MNASRVVDPTIADRLDKLATDGSAPVSWDEVRDAVEQVLATAEGDLPEGDRKLFSEIQAIAGFISEIRHDIAAIRTEDIKGQHIRSATDELDAVVGATEDATNAIMSAAEVIEAVSASLTPEQGETLAAATTRIYEACSFQDITGQRIGKAVNALKAIETKVNRLLETFGGEADRAGSGAAIDSSAHGRTALLEGPQHPDTANNQDDVDALLASLD